jgi:hypothetical protein
VTVLGGIAYGAQDYPNIQQGDASTVAAAGAHYIIRNLMWQGASATWEKYRDAISVLIRPRAAKSYYD